MNKYRATFAIQSRSRLFEDKGQLFLLSLLIIIMMILLTAKLFEVLFNFMQDFPPRACTTGQIEDRFVEYHHSTKGGLVDLGSPWGPLETSKLILVSHVENVHLELDLN